MRRLDTVAGRHGFRGLLVLRLIPAVPFNVLNFGPGLTAMTWKAYAGATALGIIPGTAVYTLFADALLQGSQDASRTAFGRVLLAGVLLAALTLIPAVLKKRGISLPGSAGGAGAPRDPPRRGGGRVIRPFRGAGARCCVRGSGRRRGSARAGHRARRCGGTGRTSDSVDHQGTRDRSPRARGRDPDARRGGGAPPSARGSRRPPGPGGSHRRGRRLPGPDAGGGPEAGCADDPHECGPGPPDERRRESSRFALDPLPTRGLPPAERDA